MLWFLRQGDRGTNAGSIGCLAIRGGEDPQVTGLSVSPSQAMARMVSTLTSSSPAATVCLVRRPRSIHRCAC